MQAREYGLDWERDWIQASLGSGVRIKTDGQAQEDGRGRPRKAP